MSRTCTEHGGAQESLWHPMESSFPSLSLLPCVPLFYHAASFCSHSPSPHLLPMFIARSVAASASRLSNHRLIHLFRLSGAYPPSPRTLPPATAATTVHINCNPQSLFHQFIAQLHPHRESRPVQPLAGPLIFDRWVHLLLRLGRCHRR